MQIHFLVVRFGFFFSPPFFGIFLNETMDQVRILLEKFVHDEQGDADGSAVAANSTGLPKPTMRSGISLHHVQPTINCHLPVDEVENEAITLASDYLSQNGFPPSFTWPVARQCVDKDLSLHLECAVAKKSEICEPGSDESGISTPDLPQGPETDKVNAVCDEQLMVDATELSKRVRNSVRAYCRQLLSDESLKEALKGSASSTPPFEWVAHAVRNSRRKMEDRHVVLPNAAWLYPKIPNADQTAAFSVYDGHGGQECAEYARSHGFYHVFHSPSYPNDILQALQDGFDAVDTRMLKYCEREGRQSGTTAVTAIIQGDTVYVGWAGDSRALIVERCGLQKLTDPVHDTKNQAELARIEAAGGLVFNFQGQDRVNGLLNITRSLGDLALKPSPLTAQPEVAKVQLTGSEACLILASDGLFDGNDWEQVAQLVQDYLKKHSAEEYPGLAKHLVDVACNKTSDNVTVIVVFLKSMKRLKEWFQ